MLDKVGSVDGVFLKSITHTTLGRRRFALLTALLASLLLFSCGSILPVPQQKARFSVSSLKGNYTYNLGGTVLGLPNGYSLYHEAGSFTADGNGSLAGVDDFMSGTTLVSGSSTGSYTINNDGTGMLTLSAPGRQIQLAITMQSATQVYLLEVDTYATGSGGAFSQSSIAMAPLSGPYVFRLYSHIVGGASSVAIGRIIVSGGSINGNEDVAQIGTGSSHTITGTLTQPDSNGRGTLSLTNDAGNTINEVYYAIDSNHLDFIEADSGVVGEGGGMAQTDVSFTNASIENGFTFRLGGDTATYFGGFAALGAFTSDGNGNITSGSLDSAVDGATSTNESFTGTYSIDSRGRASITLSPAGANPNSAIAWMADSTQGFFLPQAQNAVIAGTLTQQRGDPFSPASLQGEYSFRLLGFNGQSPKTVGAVGVMTFDGNATVTLVDFFVSQNGTLSHNGAASGSYSISPNGRVVTRPITGVSKSLVLYFTSSTSGYILFTDPGTEIAGEDTQQVPQ